MTKRTPFDIRLKFATNIRTFLYFFLFLLFIFSIVKIITLGLVNNSYVKLEKKTYQGISKKKLPPRE
ncbi:hypothetical protein HMPREF1154_2429 [Capnocytophaga sp. CM59]|nr:hypothetical protein HMPREF1154_2429 [Capnocytophaga sp. CM59]